LGLNSWITSSPLFPLSLPPQHVFLVSNFLNLAIFVGEKMEKIVQIQGKM
jgi:hypothetical protein